MQSLTLFPTLATLLLLLLLLPLPFSRAAADGMTARDHDHHNHNNQEKENKIPIAKEWLDNAARQPSTADKWSKNPPKPPKTQHLTLCNKTSSSSPAVADLAGVARADLPKGCDRLPLSLNQDWIYFSKWTLVVADAGPSSSPPKKQQQPWWILAQDKDCAFVVTSWHAYNDNSKKKNKNKLTIEVGNDDVKKLVQESLDRHVRSATNADPFQRVGTNGTMDCGGVHLDWQLRKMNCPEGPRSARPTWCTEK